MHHPPTISPVLPEFHFLQAFVPFAPFVVKNQNPKNKPNIKIGKIATTISTSCLGALVARNLKNKPNLPIPPNSYTLGVPRTLGGKPIPQNKPNVKIGNSPQPHRASSISKRSGDPQGGVSIMQNKPNVKIGNFHYPINFVS